MAFMHVLCIGFFGMESWEYWKLPLSSVAPVLLYFGIIMPASVLHGVSIYFAFVAITHSLMLLDMLLMATRYHCFSLRSKRRPATNRKMHPPLRYLFGRIVHSYNLVLGERGLFGVRSRHFVVVYAMRKICETVLNSVQAYRMSLLVSHAVVNDFYVLTIVATCWLIPVVYHVFRYHPVLVRLLCLILDFIMAFVTAVGIPLILSVPYLKEYDYERADFPMEFWSDEIWVSVMLNDLRIVLLSSWTSVVTQITFSASLLLCLQDFKALMRPHSPKPGVILLPVNTAVQLKIRTNLRARPSFAVPLSASDTHFVKGLHVLLTLWGVVVLVLHLRVAFRISPVYCMFEVRSWFSSKAECAILHVDCNVVAGSTGNLTEIDTALNGLDEHVLTHLKIQHCAFVEIPPRIQKFPQIEDFMIINSTIARWDADAALTAACHPNIQSFFASEVNLTHIPLGLLSPDFPLQLGSIGFDTTNITTVPDAVADIWPDFLYVTVDYSQLQSVPQGLLNRSSSYLSLAFNNITTLPGELFSRPSASNVWLGGNPITELPDALTPSKSIVFIDLSRTNLQSLPSWADTAFFQNTGVNAAGSPLCDQVLAAEATNSTPLGLTVALEAHRTSQLQCYAFG